jgi:hypothetical protein
VSDDFDLNLDFLEKKHAASNKGGGANFGSAKNQGQGVFPRKQRIIKDPLAEGLHAGHEMLDATTKQFKDILERPHHNGVLGVIEDVERGLYVGFVGAIEAPLIGAMALGATVKKTVDTIIENNKDDDSLTNA